MVISPKGGGRLLVVAAVAAGSSVVIYLGATLSMLSGAPAGAALTRRLPGGTLVICGGQTTDLIRDRFVELAGGRDARIVVIPTANDDPDGPGAEARLGPWQARRVASVRRLHARSRQEADDPAFVLPLEQASGVWIGGGEQARLTEVYLGTLVEDRLKALLARGGVIGGTSAGAAVMSRVMIVGGRGAASLGQGFDLLTGALIDQHFLRRNRVSRLLGALRERPDLIGLGIDEGTALVVDVRTRRLRVIGDSYAVAILADPGATRIDVLKPGDEADLNAFRSRPESAVASAIDFDEL